MATQHKNPLTFESAMMMLGTKSTKKIADNTLLVRKGEGATIAIQVTLHDNLIMLLRPHQTQLFQGYHELTVTTKRRLTEYLPQGYCLGTNKGVNYLHTPDGKVEFINGMTLASF